MINVPSTLNEDYGVSVAAEGECIQACMASCEVGNSGCNACMDAGCQVACQYSCQYTCESACQDTCETSCQDTCQTSCQETCQISCQNCQGASCQTCQNCEGNACLTSCQNCEGACLTTCEASCQTTCLTYCQNCQGDSCLTYCMGCQDACQYYSQRPSNWSWSTTVKKGNKVSMVNGAPAYLTATEWNNFTSRINSFRSYKGKSTVTFTAAVKGKPMTAAQVNAAITAISAMSPSSPVPSQVTAGTKITAEFINALSAALNSL